MVVSRWFSLFKAFYEVNIYYCVKSTIWFDHIFAQITGIMLIYSSVSNKEWADGISENSLSRGGIGGGILKIEKFENSNKINKYYIC